MTPSLKHCTAIMALSMEHSSSSGIVSVKHSPLWARAYSTKGTKKPMQVAPLA